MERSKPNELPLTIEVSAKRTELGVVVDMIAQAADEAIAEGCFRRPRSQHPSLQRGVLRLETTLHSVVGVISDHMDNLAEVFPALTYRSLL